MGIKLRETDADCGNKPYKANQSHQSGTPVMHNLVLTTKGGETMGLGQTFSWKLHAHTMSSEML